jgi:hypothetical protein
MWRGFVGCNGVLDIVRANPLTDADEVRAAARRAEILASKRFLSGE